MRKHVLIGGGLGLLLLAIVASSMRMAGHVPDTSPTTPVVVAPVVNHNPAAPAIAPAVPVAVDAASQAQKQEQRRRLAEVRTELNALSAKGGQASLEKMRALVDELEALSPPGFDPRYFQALRNMLDASAKVQVLNTELQGLAKSAAPKDLARQEAILGELRALGERVQTEAKNLQAYASAVSKARVP